MPYTDIATKQIFRRDRGAARWGHTGPYTLCQPKAVRRRRGRCHPGLFGALDDTSNDQYRPGALSDPSSQHPQRSRRGHWFRRPQQPWCPRWPWALEGTGILRVPGALTGSGALSDPCAVSGNGAPSGTGGLNGTFHNLVRAP